ncbi:hypothetical protein PMN64_00570 [Bradyrhizobium sp. UFLA01-814]|uniref:hypothetical protein n=1 Tax=Bradyrhizobium sp. UFLA01-814 TaxID=3023480 RepID=UPI00398B3083
MTDFMFKSQFFYRRHYVRKRCRLEEWIDLNDTCDVAISEVDAKDAPIAYEVAQFNGEERQPHEIRSYAGSMWWPLHGADGPLKSAEFRSMVENDWETASAILDPLHRTYRLCNPLKAENFGRIEVREDKDRSTFDLQLAGAHRDASRLLFCGGDVLVEGGDPVWYFIPAAQDRKGVDLVLGPTTLNRREAAGYSMPGPERHVRLSSGWHGHVFGLTEIEAAKEGWATEQAINVRSEIAARHYRPTTSAADLCARAVAEHLWDIAWMYSGLRQAVPAVANANHLFPAPDFPEYREMLRQLISQKNPELSRNLSRLIASAKTILDRLELNGPTDEDDDAALASLGV